jgi:NTP pyrophosphatase (non-canonical NTP hydrolase)
MEFNDYQLGALETAQYPEVEVPKYEDGTIYSANYVYPALGLVGEAGEVAEKIKKLIRDQGGHYNDNDVQGIKKELGDVLWYVAVLAHEFDIKLDDIATTNYNKLKSRKERNVIKGSGDDR